MPVPVRTKKFVPKLPNPQSDPRFKNVKEKVGQKASKLKKHPPAKQKAGEAAKAAKGPPNEKAAGAKSKQVDTLKDTKAETPPADSFLATLRAEIDKVMPSNMEDADNFMDGGAESEMKGAVGGNVKDQKQAASGDLEKNSAKPPSESGVQAKPVEAMPPDPNVPVETVNGGAGMPAPKPDAEISEKQTKADAQTAMKENRLEGKRLENKDRRFETVKSEKGNVDRVADASPGKYRGGEKQTLGKAAAQANIAAKGGMTALTSVKNKSKSAVQLRQEAQKQKDEARRKVVTDRIEAIYTETKQTVDSNLNSLERDVMAIFDPGCSSTIASFKAKTNSEIDRFYAQRYSGLSGKADWLLDKFKDTPPKVKEIIKANLIIFTESMDDLAVRVAGMVDKRLNKAKADIDTGQAKIKAFVASLPKDLKSVGEEAEKAMESRFNEMRDGVESKKNDLAQKLAEKYKAATDQANELAKKIEEENAGAFKKLADAIGEVIKIIMEFKDKLMALLKKAADTIELILDDPIGFLGNLISAVKTGVNQFVGNIWTHLKAGFMQWLFGALAGAGIEIPADLSLVSIFKLVMGVLGITYAKMRAKAVKILGPTAVAVIEKLVEYVSALITGGPAKLWEQVKADIGDLKAMVIDAIQSWLIDTIIKQATIKMLSFFNPAGAFIQAILAIYNTVMFIIESASQIMAFVEAVINSVSSIAQGAIGAAANWIEQSLARMIPLVIGFLARLIGLGGISKKVKEFITKVQDKVDKAIDKAIAKIVTFVKKLFGKGKGPADRKPPDSVGKTVTFTGGKESHRLWLKVSGKKAEVMIASTPKTLAEFLADPLIREVAAEKSELSKAISQASGKAGEVKTSAAEVLSSTNQARIEQAEKTTEQKEDDLSAILVKILNLLEGTNAEIYGYIGKKLVQRGTDGAPDKRLVTKKIRNYSFMTVKAAGREDMRRNPKVSPPALKEKLPEVYLDGGGILQLGANPGQDTRSSNEKLIDYRKILSDVGIADPDPKIGDNAAESELSIYRQKIRRAIVTDSRYSSLDGLNALFESRKLHVSWQGTVFEEWMVVHSGAQLNSHQLTFELSPGTYVKADNFSGDKLFEAKSQLLREGENYKVADREEEQIINYATVIRRGLKGFSKRGGFSGVGPFTSVNYYCNYPGVARAFKTKLDALLPGKATVYLGRALFNDPPAKKG